MASWHNHSADDLTPDPCLSEQRASASLPKTCLEYGLLEHGYYQVLLGKLIPSQDNWLEKLTL